MNRVRLIAVGATLLVACGSSTTGSSRAVASAAQAYLMRLDELVAGKLDTLPTGGQFVRIVVFHQAPGITTPSRKHQAGIIYQQIGQQRLAYSGGKSIDIAPSSAVFLESVAHSHTNDGGVENTWYFIALWPGVQRGLPLLSGSQVAFETEDLPPGALQPGSYVETLRRLALRPGGHSAAHFFGGLEVVFVLDGNLTLDIAGGSPVHLTAGQGTYLAPGTATQELTGGSSAVDYLAYFVTRQGQAFETDVASVPSS